LVAIEIRRRSSRAHRQRLGFRLWCVLFTLGLPASAAAVSLTLAPVLGQRDAPEAGIFTLDPSDGSRTPTAYRCAQSFYDLRLTPWTPIVNTPVTIIRLLPGFQHAFDHVVTCEVRYTAGEPVRVSVVEDIERRDGGASLLPRDFLWPAAGKLVDLLRLDTTGFGAWPVVQYNDQGASIMRYAAGNNFVPLEWAGNHAWASDRTWGIDKGEPRLNTTIVAHVYARWLGAPDVMDWTPSSTALLIDLRGENLDLKGGQIYFAVLMALPDGRHARYHLRRPLDVVNGAWRTSGWYVPSGTNTDWWCSYASNNQPCSDMPGPGPDLRYIEAVEVLMVDGILPPTGLLKLRNLQVWQ
jgi:hypothetical protein